MIIIERFRHGCSPHTVPRQPRRDQMTHHDRISKCNIRGAALLLRQLLVGNDHARVALRRDSRAIVPSPPRISIFPLQSTDPLHAAIACRKSSNHLTNHRRLKSIASDARPPHISRGFLLGDLRTPARCARATFMGRAKSPIADQILHRSKTTRCANNRRSIYRPRSHLGTTSRTP